MRPYKSSNLKENSAFVSVYQLWTWVSFGVTEPTYVHTLRSIFLSHLSHLIRVVVLKGGPWTSTISIISGLVSHTDSQILLPTHWTRNSRGETTFWVLASPLHVANVIKLWGRCLWGLSCRFKLWSSCWFNVSPDPNLTHNITNDLHCSSQRLGYAAWLDQFYCNSDLELLI